MSCSNCKKKNEFKNEIVQSSEFVSKGVVWFVVIWSLFALFGIYSLIKLLL